MKHLILPAMTATLLSVAVQSAELKTDDQKASYGIGVNIGTQLSRETNLEIDMKALVEGLEDALGEKELDLNEEQIREAFAAVQQRAQAKVAAAADENKAKAETFLADNAKKDGVVVLEEGLQYSVISSGKGDAKPTAADTVKTHYHGTLLDGTVFDSSVDRGEPISFPLNGVIPGWTKALQEMSVGDKWKLFIHPDLAYGPRGSGSIPPNSALIFEVELIEINPAQ